MPELPEVETVRRYLSLQLPGSLVLGVTLRREDLRYPIPVDAVQALEGHRLSAVRRRAKYLLLDFEPAATALIHLGMSGRLFTTPPTPDWQLHEHWRLHLRSEAGLLDLRYVDARRFGCLDILSQDAKMEHPLLAVLGPEPLGPGFSAAELLRQTRGRQAPIKAWLMDSHRVVGVGNIYASEACFRARVHPLRAVNDLDLQDCDRLVASVRTVLEDAIAAGGSTLRDFVGGDAKPGYFQQQLAVYGRGGEPCQACGAPIERFVLGTRATYCCPNCQV